MLSLLKHEYLEVFILRQS